METYWSEQHFRNLELGAKVCGLMAHLQRHNDPRYEELLAVLEEGRKKYETDESLDPFYSGHKAVFNYVEAKHPAFYSLIQTTFSASD